MFRGTRRQSSLSRPVIGIIMVLSIVRIKHWYMAPACIKMPGVDRQVLDLPANCGVTMIFKVARWIYFVMRLLICWDAPYPMMERWVYFLRGLKLGIKRSLVPQVILYYRQYLWGSTEILNGLIMVITILFGLHTLIRCPLSSIGETISTKSWWHCWSIISLFHQRLNWIFIKCGGQKLIGLSR